MSIRVMIVDDHPLIRSGLRLSIERSKADIQVVAEASNGEEAVERAGTTPVDVCILDITMPGLNGLDAAGELLRLQPTIKIVILSFHSSRAMVERALAVGALGYLTKETATERVVEALREVHAGRCYLSPDIANVAVDEYVRRVRRAVPGRSGKLSGQERKVLQLIAEGLSSKEIAAKLGRRENTIHTHRNKLMAKLGIHKAADLARYAVREGITNA